MTNEVNQPRATLARQPPTQSTTPAKAIRLNDLLVDFIAHQPLTLQPHRTLDPSHQRPVATLTSTGSPGRVPTTHATWLGAHPATFTARCQPALTRRLR